MVRMLVGLSGMAYSLSPKDEHDFPQDEAIRLISAGFAVPVSDIQVERAVKTPVAERRAKRGKNVVSGNGNGSGN